jgi:hypothetical protein
MKTIARTFNTLTAAERYQNKLYDRYNHVRLVSSPYFSQEGVYTWEVKE